ncbi:MAG: hypothetical protein PHQ05_11505 [Sterolibacterium sp.]|nr:hypothetical protein [Sterolibacterium sp.]
MNAEIKPMPDMRKEIDGVVVAAFDAATDEMVGRLASTAADTLDLVDQFNRAGLDKAIPMLAQLVNTGDLQRLVNLARVVGSAEDALTDEMVGRVTDAVGGGLSLLDQVNRSGIEKALPTLARMVADGDLERMAQLARVYGSAQDVLTDEMIGRFAETMGEGLSLLDRLHRGGGAVRLVEMLERLETSGALERIAIGLPILVDRLEMVVNMFMCMEEAAAKAKQQPATGGFGGIWRMLTDVQTQQTLRFLLELGQKMQDNCVKR